MKGPRAVGSVRSDVPTISTSKIRSAFGKIESLNLPNDSTARSLLRRAASDVKPLMLKRGWFVSQLAEMFPPFPGLLGLNHDQGRRIELRLRHPTSVITFLDYNCILDTLLHELVHIEIGPHDDAFYRLRKELYKDFLQHYPDGPRPGGCRNAILGPPPNGVAPILPGAPDTPTVVVVRPVLVNDTPMLGAVILLDGIASNGKAEDVSKSDDGTKPVLPISTAPTVQPSPGSASSSLSSFAHRPSRQKNHRDPIEPPPAGSRNSHVGPRHISRHSKERPSPNDKFFSAHSRSRDSFAERSKPRDHSCVARSSSRNRPVSSSRSRSRSAAPVLKSPCFIRQ